MYSRSRQEERYRGNVPPLYGGSHFRYERQEESGVRASVEPEARAAVKTEEKPEGCASLPAPGTPPERSEKPDAHRGLPELFSGIGQEELLLLALLLLLCAEHDKSMDVIVILLLLLGVQ